jgi:hypothetical protein
MSKRTGFSPSSMRSFARQDPINPTPPVIMVAMEIP